TAERREAWERIARKPYSDEEKAQALARLLGLVDRMEEMLAEGGGEWLMGSRYTLADIAAVPFVARIAELAPDAVGAGDGAPGGAVAQDRAGRPRVADWWSRVQRRPAFEAARIERFDVALARRAAQQQSDAASARS